MRGTDRSNLISTTAQQYPEGTPGKAVAADEKSGHFGNNYPEHLNVADFLGLPRQDRLNLAIVSPGNFFITLSYDIVYSIKVLDGKNQSEYKKLTRKNSNFFIELAVSCLYNHQLY